MMIPMGKIAACIVIVSELMARGPLETYRDDFVQARAEQSGHRTVDAADRECYEATHGQEYATHCLYLSQQEATRGFGTCFAV